MDHKEKVFCLIAMNKQSLTSSELANLAKETNATGGYAAPQWAARCIKKLKDEGLITLDGYAPPRSPKYKPSYDGLRLIFDEAHNG